MLSCFGCKSFNLFTYEKKLNNISILNGIVRGWYGSDDAQ